jgi:triphosphoribosyl-dephospho-CoA synthetase
LEELGANLRLVGREMESAMFEATGGVNTHKGLIFALSLIVGASGLCFSRGRTSKDSVLKTAGDLIRASVTEEMEDIGRRGRRGEELTHGEKIYFLHGIGGIRAEAKNGFPSVKKGLDALEEAVSRGAALRDAAISALLVLMAECEDTNVMHRGGVRFWSGEYKEMTRDAMAKFDPVDPRFYESVRYLDKRLIERGASPGGAADLLACTLFMYRSII